MFKPWCLVSVRRNSGKWREEWTKEMVLFEESSRTLSYHVSRLEGWRRDGVLVMRGGDE